MDPPAIISGNKKTGTLIALQFPKGVGVVIILTVVFEVVNCCVVVEGENYHSTEVLNGVTSLEVDSDELVFCHMHDPLSIYYYKG